MKKENILRPDFTKGSSLMPGETTAHRQKNLKEAKKDPLRRARILLAQHMRSFLMKLPVKIKQFEELANNKEAELDSYKEAYGEFILESNKWYKKLDRMLQDIIEDPQPRTDEHRRIMDRLRNHLEKLKMDFTGSGSSIDAQIDVIRNLAKRFGVENE